MAKFTFDDSAFDEITNELNELSEKATKFGERDVPLEELFNAEFMKFHANSEDIYDFLSNGNIDIDLADFDDLSDDAFNKYVSEKTDFLSWDEMYSEAINLYLDEQLGL